MAIKFKVIPKKNPQNLNDPPKFYAQAVSTGKDTTASLAREIAQFSNVERGEIIEVLAANANG